MPILEITQPLQPLTLLKPILQNPMRDDTATQKQIINLRLRDAPSGNRPPADPNPQSVKEIIQPVERHRQNPFRVFGYGDTDVITVLIFEPVVWDWGGGRVAALLHDGGGVEHGFDDEGGDDGAGSEGGGVVV